MQFVRSQHTSSLHHYFTFKIIADRQKIVFLSADFLYQRSINLKVFFVFGKEIESIIRRQTTAKAGG